jgi:oligopeptide/dipeptide ABC transporter ATP-binding protein
MNNESLDYIVKVQNLTKRFSLESGFFARKDRFVYALNDVSFNIERGKTYGLVGESGCGKSTTAKILVGMYKADSGSVEFSFKKDERDAVKYVFQDPSRSLNPRMSVYTVLTDGLKHSKKWPGKEKAREMAEQILEEVGLDKSDLDRRPQEFSGGQRQRISIARGLMAGPELLICDEVVSALDVSIQGQILNLLQDLRAKRGLTYFFIAHDLRVSCYFCDTIGVMYRGVLVEEAPARDLYKTALHPYTKLLFEGSMHSSAQENGEVKSVLSSLTGCPYAHRCPKAGEQCRTSLPEWKEVSAGHKVRCFFFG